MGRAARLVVEARFSVDVMARETERLFAGLVAGEAR